MSCYGCMTKFSFFQKENACASCGFGFCSRCLKNKQMMPGETKLRLICNPCNKLYNNKPSSAPNPSLRQSTNVDIKASSACATNGNYYLEQLTRLNQEDQQIAQRLKDLRSNPQNSNTPASTKLSTTEIEERLRRMKGSNVKLSDKQIEARLRYVKGEQANVSNQKKTLFLSDLRTDQERVDDLLERYVAETEIELAHSPESEIEARLASLRHAGVRPNSTPYLNQLIDSEESDEDIDKLTRKIMDEVALDKSLAATSSIGADLKKKHPRHLKNADRGQPLHASTPELSFCVICLADAKRRCINCEEPNSIYCVRCYDEIHRDWGETDHKFIDYVPRRFMVNFDDDDDEESDDDDEEEIDSDDQIEPNKNQQKNV